MASCYDRVSCSVSEDGQVLTINTKHGTCMFTRGDDVSFTETEVGYIITINGNPYIIPKIEPGDDVDFTETDDCYIITINNEPHCIPKCRYYRDCDGNILDDCARIVTCDDIAQRGFISCVDPDDFTLTTECEEGDCVNCIAIKWDQICAEAETTDSMPDNGQVLYCSGGSVSKTNFNNAVEEVISGCMEIDIPDLGTTCGDPRSLVLVENNGCVSLATYSSSDAQRAGGTFREAHPEIAPDTTGLILPDSFADPTDYYVPADYRAAADAGTLDEGTLTNSMITLASFNLACPQRLSMTLSYDNVNPPSVQDAYDQTWAVAWRRRVDGGPWIYPLSAGSVTTSTPRNALASERLMYEINGRVFPAGDNEVQFFYTAAQTGNARITANTFAFDPASPQPLPSVALRPVL